MTDTITNEPILTDDQVDALADVQQRIGAANAAKGFHERGDFLRHAIERATVHGEYYGLDLGFWQDTHNEYIGNRLLLVVSEVVEAHDEIRSGRSVHDTYYGENGKPEGFKSEIADARIRLHDLEDELELEGAEATAEKLDFNATREHMHGRKF